MGKNSTNKITHKFLTNQPLGEDLFENKSQDKIAKVISEKIINEPEFKIIGIDGEWGSGKSNLVRLVEKKLESTHKFFVYDVWGHQEDEQRKAILVELTDFIQNENGLLKKGDKKVWDDKLKVLLAKSKETTTINQPYLSVGFIFSLLSIIYIPTVNVFKDTIKNFFEIDSLFWKFILVTCPILIVIGIYLWHLVKGWVQKKGIWKSFRLSAEKTFQVYTNKQKEETKIETVSEDQPSVRDFQNWMEDINKDLNKKIVIVFDNFDRLPKKHILNIWSSIHIFFAEKEYSNIKVIIPFDREHVQNAFKELNGTDNKFGNDYVNKTFDIVFRITLPIMSNWKKFFREQWKIAFNGHVTDELDRVIQVYEFLGGKNTPREIINFINEIITNKFIDDNYKEEYIAIFILCKDSILINPLRAITNLQYLKGLESLYKYDEDLPKQLTAIVYQLDVDKALELIYTDQLKKALGNVDIELFENLCQIDTINDIFPGAIYGLGDTIIEPIYTLDKYIEKTKLNTEEVKKAWKSLYNKRLSKQVSVENYLVEKHIMILLKNVPDSDFKLLKELIKSIYPSTPEGMIIDKFIGIIDEIIEIFGEDIALNLLPNKKILPKDILSLIDFKENHFTKYKLTCIDSDLDNHLIEISRLSIDELMRYDSKLLSSNFILPEYQGILKTIFHTSINQNDILSSNNLLLKIKETIKEGEESSLVNLLSDSQIATTYIRIGEELPIKNELIAMRIARGHNFHPQFANRFDALLKVNDELLVSNISNTILNYIDSTSLLLLSINNFESTLYNSIVLELITRSSLKNLDIKSIVYNYDTIKSKIGIKKDDLLKIIDFEYDFESVEIGNLLIDDFFLYSELNISKSYIEKFKMF